MKRLWIAGALLMAVSSVASADGWQDWREGAKDHGEAQREYDKDRREALREAEKDRREAWKERAKDERRWARGEYLPREYLMDRYYVRDYRAYDLAPPPPGYGWVRPDPRDDAYYMVQLATGVIAQILGR